MLFKDSNGKYVIINKSDFVNDKDYYEQILFTKGHKCLSKSDNVIDNYVRYISKEKGVYYI